MKKEGKDRVITRAIHFIATNTKKDSHRIGQAIIAELELVKKLTSTNVAPSAKEAIFLLKYYEKKCFKKVNGELVLVRGEHLQKYNTYKKWIDNRELNYR